MVLVHKADPSANNVLVCQVKESPGFAHQSCYLYLRHHQGESLHLVYQVLPIDLKSELLELVVDDLDLTDGAQLL